MSQKKVLIIEDNEAIARSVAYTLKGAGFEVLVANEGMDGIALAGTDCPDIILLDTIMPNYSGYDVLKKLKSNPSTTDIPVAIFSNLDRAEDEKLMRELGAQYFFSKSDMDGQKVAAKLTQILG